MKFSIGQPMLSPAPSMALLWALAFEKAADNSTMRERVKSRHP
jgi:hypothetical protein